MSEPLPSRTEEVQAVSSQMIRVAVVLLTGHTTLRAHMIKTQTHTGAGLPTVRGQKRRYCTYCVSLSGTGLQKIQNLGLYVLDAQGSRKQRVNGLISLVANTRLRMAP